MSLGYKLVSRLIVSHCGSYLIRAIPIAYHQVRQAVVYSIHHHNVAGQGPKQSIDRHLPPRIDDDIPSEIAYMHAESNRPHCTSSLFKAPSLR